MSPTIKNHRILIIDDNRAIHEDFKKILSYTYQASDSLLDKEKLLFGDKAESSKTKKPTFTIDSAYQGKEGLELANEAAANNKPYSMAFIDVRMPPGWDGIETTKQIWKLHPDLQVVICTAFSDYASEEMLEAFGQTDRLVLLKKPFDNVEVLQLASAMTVKWDLLQSSKLKMEQLEYMAETRAIELKKANAFLEKEIVQHKKTAKQLEEARRLAESAMKARSFFLANMSHEIRTPLNGIMGMNELLMETELSEEQEEYASSVMDSSQNLLCIINDILDFSKIDAGKLEIENIRIDLDELLRRIIYVQSKVALRKGIAFTEVRDPNIPNDLKGDPQRLKQILTNLFSNAIKFTNEGSVNFSIEIVNETGRDVELKFVVKDTGIGISTAVQQNLFQPFIQADSSTTRTYGGTGLGLAICKNLVELMKGRIGLESEVGQGACFWFTLTFEKQPILSSAERALQNESSKEVTNHPFVAARILIAEDSPVGQEVIRKHLLHLGHKPVVVPDGQAAIEALLQVDFDLIFLDCQMPVMNGYQAAQGIRQLEDKKKASVPIIALTANAMDGARQQCLDAGMDDFITKPISQRSFRSAIARNLKATQ